MFQRFLEKRKQAQQYIAEPVFSFLKISTIPPSPLLTLVDTWSSALRTAVSVAAPDTDRVEPSPRTARLAGWLVVGAGNLAGMADKLAALVAADTVGTAAPVGKAGCMEAADS
jgi:hypothetical protein